MYNQSELKNKQLEILKEIDRVCKKNDITYFLAWGTCLGAVRHKGFIPWDDDIDIAMHINDFEKLIRCSSDFKDNYFLQTSETDHEYGLMIGRVRDTNTTLIEETESWRNINHGVFVDIYPMFNAPKNSILLEFFAITSMVYRLMLYGVVPQNRGSIMKYGSFVLLKVTPKCIREILINLTYKILSSYKSDEYWCGFHGNCYKTTFSKSLFLPVKISDFEGLAVPIPNDADALLKMRYGNYMELPPESERVVHHPYSVVDLENSYVNYYGKEYCVNRN